MTKGKETKMKAIAFAMLFAGILVSTAADAQSSTKDKMWESEYLSIVEGGLYALKAEKYEEAYTKLLEGAKLGNKTSQYYLAQMYFQGWGIEPNYEEGWLWLQVAMEQKTAEWNRSFRSIRDALPEDFKTSMQPYVDEHIALYGAKAQDLRCEKRAAIGSNIKEIICSKRFY